MAHVVWLSVAPVKGMALTSVDEIEIGPLGVAENRRFWLIEADGRAVTGARAGTLAQIAPEATNSRLALRFPDGALVDGELQLGAAVETGFYGRSVPGRVVEGRWNDAVSAFAGRELRIVRGDAPGAGVDRDNGPVSLVSEASLARLAEAAGRRLQAERFRMLIGLDGVAAHEEDTWCGREVRVGEALVRPLEPVERCAVTTHDPATGIRDFDTLRTIRGYREGPTIDFGVFGEVVEPGRVRVGDPVELVI